MTAHPGQKSDAAPRRVAAYTIHVCPECGYYDADPILKRKDGKRCPRCGQEAEKALDLSRVNPSWRALRRSEARDGAPLMVATKVVPAP